MTLQQIVDIREIEDVLKRYIRGYDRGDEALMLGCYHDGAVDMHGTFDGLAVDFVKDTLRRAAINGVGIHPISNITIEFERDGLAWSEAYFISFNRFVDDKKQVDLMVAGRYLDRFERRRGVWKIAHRQVVYDFMQEGLATDRWERPPFAGKVKRGIRSSEDYVFARRRDFQKAEN